MITTNYSSSLYNLRNETNRITTDLNKLTDQVATGLEVTSPSDAPAQIETIHKLSDQLADQEVWINNAELVDDYMSTADNALGSVIDVLTRLREMCVQYSSDSYNDEDRAAAQTELETLFTEVIGLSNTQMGGHYLFSGTAYDQEAFDSSGNYLGTNDQPSTSAGNGLYLSTGFDGSEVFQSDVDIFALMDDIMVAFQNNDTNAIASALPQIDTSIDMVSAARAEVGLTSNLALDIVSLSENLSTVLASGIEDLVGADLVSTYTKLTELQTTYQAVLQLTSSRQGMNLFSMM